MSTPNSNTPNLAPRVHVPKQGRSRRTLERLLDAAEEVLSEKSFEQAKVSEIAARAGFTTGAFYARFPTKDVLLDALVQRVKTQYEDALEGLEGLRGAVSLEALIDALVDAFAGAFSNRSWLARSTAVRSNPALRQPVDRLNLQLMERLAALLLHHREEIGHPDPPQAVEHCLLMTSASLREIVVFRELWLKRGRGGPERTIAELKLALRSYLQIRPRGDLR